MTEIISVMDNLIRRVKRLADFSDIRFIKAYSNHSARRAPSGKTVFVELVSIERRREFFGGMFKSRAKAFLGVAGFNLRLSCGMSGSGEDLGLTALRLVEKLRDEDCERYIEDYSIGKIHYDRDLGTIYRNIHLKLAFVYSGGSL